MPNLDRVLWHLLGGTRGGPTRIRLIEALRQRPQNANQLAGTLGLDYKTVQHHLRVAVQNRILEPQTRVGPSGERSDYGAVYFLSRDFREAMETYLRIRDRLRGGD